MATTANNDDDSKWTFIISLGDGDGNDNNNDDDVSSLPPRDSSTTCFTTCREDDVPQVPQDVVESFRRDGFAVFPRVLSPSLVHDLNERLEEILRGHYDRGQKPDKTPKLIKSTSTNSNIGPLGFSGNLQNVKVLQVINVHKSDRLFRKLVTHPALGKVVADLAGWHHRDAINEETDNDNVNVVAGVGVRLAQDQVWAKPPGAPPLTFHRDSPYFMFTPNDVVTVWMALDDMDDEIGPLEYVRGSHAWGDGRVGSANQFFPPDRGMTLLYSAAAREGILKNASGGDDPLLLDIVSMAGLRAGGISIHDGRTWHGSGRNTSTNRPRRGIGIHYVPAHVRFTPDAAKSRLWKPYVVRVHQQHESDEGVSIDESADGNSNISEVVELSDEDFPIVWKPRR
jgi:phytanoyl-CoA hydroxylase